MTPGWREDVAKPRTQVKRKSSLLGLLNGPLSGRNILIWTGGTNGWRRNVPHQNFLLSSKQSTNSLTASLMRALKSTLQPHLSCQHPMHQPLQRPHLCKALLSFGLCDSLLKLCSLFLCLTNSYPSFRAHVKMDSPPWNFVQHHWDKLASCSPLCAPRAPCSYHLHHLTHYMIIMYLPVHLWASLPFNFISNIQYKANTFDVFSDF